MRNGQNPDASIM